MFYIYDHLLKKCFSIFVDVDTTITHYYIVLATQCCTSVNISSFSNIIIMKAK